MYLDDELMEVEHLCCLAHARNKFKDTYNQGCEKARFFLEQIAKLYKREDDYRRDKLTATQTKEKRNDAYTKVALRSAVYNTFIETCKQTGISFRSFFCKYMTEIRKGRTDYENLLPMTISLTN